MSWSGNNDHRSGRPNQKSTSSFDYQHGQYREYNDDDVNDFQLRNSSKGWHPNEAKPMGVNKLRMDGSLNSYHNPESNMRLSDRPWDNQDFTPPPNIQDRGRQPVLDYNNPGPSGPVLTELMTKGLNMLFKTSQDFNAVNQTDQGNRAFDQGNRSFDQGNRAFDQGNRAFDNYRSDGGIRSDKRLTDYSNERQAMQQQKKSNKAFDYLKTWRLKMNMPTDSFMVEKELLELSKQQGLHSVLSSSLDIQAKFMQNNIPSNSGRNTAGDHKGYLTETQFESQLLGFPQQTPSGHQNMGASNRDGSSTSWDNVEDTHVSGYKRSYHESQPNRTSRRSDGNDFSPDVSYAAKKAKLSEFSEPYKGKFNDEFKKSGQHNQKQPFESNRLDTNFHKAQDWENEVLYPKRGTDEWSAAHEAHARQDNANESSNSWKGRPTQQSREYDLALGEANRPKRSRWSGVAQPKDFQKPFGGGSAMAHEESPVSRMRPQRYSPEGRAPGPKPVGQFSANLWEQDRQGPSARGSSSHQSPKSNTPGHVRPGSQYPVAGNGRSRSPGLKRSSDVKNQGETYGEQFTSKSDLSLIREKTRTSRGSPIGRRDSPSCGVRSRSPGGYGKGSPGRGSAAPFWKTREDSFEEHGKPKGGSMWPPNGRARESSQQSRKVSPVPGGRRSPVRGNTRFQGRGRSPGRNRSPGQRRQDNKRSPEYDGRRTPGYGRAPGHGRSLGQNRQSDRRSPDYDRRRSPGHGRSPGRYRSPGHSRQDNRSLEYDGRSSLARGRSPGRLQHAGKRSPGHGRYTGTGDERGARGSPVRNVRSPSHGRRPLGHGSSRSPDLDDKKSAPLSGRILVSGRSSRSPRRIESPRFTGRTSSPGVGGRARFPGRTVSKSPERLNRHISPRYGSRDRQPGRGGREVSPLKRSRSPRCMDESRYPRPSRDRPRNFSQEKGLDVRRRERSLEPQRRRSMSQRAARPLSPDLARSSRSPRRVTIERSPDSQTRFTGSFQREESPGLISRTADSDARWSPKRTQLERRRSLEDVSPPSMHCRSPVRHDSLSRSPLFDELSPPLRPNRLYSPSEDFQVKELGSKQTWPSVKVPRGCSPVSPQPDFESLDGPIRLGPSNSGRQHQSQCSPNPYRGCSPVSPEYMSRHVEGERSPLDTQRYKSDRGFSSPKGKRTVRRYGREENLDIDSFETEASREGTPLSEGAKEDEDSEDLRVHLLRVREQKVEMKLRMLEEESLETEYKLKQLEKHKSPRW